MAKKVEVDAKLLVAAIALLIIATVGSSFATYLIFGRGDQGVTTSGETIQKRDMGPTYDVGEFTLNLTSSTATMRFIRTQIVLETSGKRVVTELETRAPQIRDQLIKLVRSRSAEQINSENGMELLRFDIIKSINSLITSGEITDVFFIDLIVQ